MSMSSRDFRVDCFSAGFDSVIFKSGLCLVCWAQMPPDGDGGEVKYRSEYILYCSNIKLVDV